MAKRMESLQGLRAIAFMAILISHTVGMEYLGYWGVSIFLILSGFVMVYTYLPRPDIAVGSIRFMLGKMKKLYPLHVVTMLACCALDILRVFLYGGKSFAEILLDVVLHTTLVQIWIPNSRFYATLNAVSWYLSVCVLLYLCFPCIIKYLKKNGERQKIHVAVGILLFIQILIAALSPYFHFLGDQPTAQEKWITYFSPIARLFDFLLGCCLGWLFCNQKKTEKKLQNASLKEIIVASLIAISFAVYQFDIFHIRSSPIKYVALFTPTSMMIVWLLARENGILSHVLRKKIFVQIGDLSPYGFLIHFAVLRYYNAAFGLLKIEIPFWIQKAVCFCIVAAGTYICTELWSVISKKCSQRNKLLDKHTAAISK